MDNPDRHRYEARIGDEVRGFVDYHLQPGLLTIMHTEVDPASEGQGIGCALVREATRVALCRCGASRAKFCDGTHREIGFTTEGSDPL